MVLDDRRLTEIDLAKVLANSLGSVSDIFKLRNKNTFSATFRVFKTRK